MGVEEMILAIWIVAIACLAYLVWRLIDWKLAADYTVYIVAALIATWVIMPIQTRKKRIWHRLGTAFRRRKPTREVIVCDNCERDNHIHGRDCRCITPWCMCTADHHHPHLDVTV